MEIIKEGEKFYHKEEIDIDEKVKEQLAIKDSLLEQIARVDATIEQLITTKG